MGLLLIFGDTSGSICRATYFSYISGATDSWFPINQQIRHAIAYCTDNIHGINKVIATGMGNKVLYNKPYWSEEQEKIISDWTVGIINDGIQPKPTAPSDLTATALSTDWIRLIWNSNSEHQANFIIERSLNGTAFSALATLAVDTTVYDNKGLNPNQTYWYRVKASNCLGDSSYSNIADATTLSPSLPSYCYISSAISLTSTTLFRSYNGLTWNPYSTVDFIIYDIIPYNDMYLIAGSNAIYTTKDFTNFTERFSAVDYNGYYTVSWKRIIHGDGTFVAIASAGAIAISTDASNWELIVTDMYTGNWGYGFNLNGVTYADGKYLIVGELGQRAISYDASNWTVLTDMTDNFWDIKAYKDSTFIIPATDPYLTYSKIYSSTDGTTYNTVFDDPDNKSLYIAASFDNSCMVAGPYERILVSSENLDTWTQINYDEYGVNLNCSLKQIDGVYYATGNNIYTFGKYVYSLDGSVWNSKIMGDTIDTITGIYPLIPGDKPEAPTDLMSIPVSHDQIDLSWTDNSINEAGFRIERSTNGINFSFLNNVSFDTTNYSDTGLSGDSTYWYRVQAFNIYGDSSYSNITHSVTPPAPPHADFEWSIDPYNEAQINFTSTATNYLYQEWDFGDGSPHDTTSTNPSHVYADYTTSYSVTYKVSNDTTSDSTTKTITTGYEYFYFQRPEFSPDTTDAITDSVHIKRDNGGGGIYNAVTESYYTKYYSPEDTEWSNPQSGIISDPTLLDYDKWHVNFWPPEVVGRYIYMHIISEDRYFEFYFFSWGAMGTGEFSYKRREIYI